MASMTISLPDAVSDRVHQRVDAGLYASASDYVRALILRDLAGDDDPSYALDRSIVETLVEMRAGGGVDLDAACEAIAAEIRPSGDRPRQ